MHIFSAKKINVSWIEKQGLLAIKIGQTFALRADFLPPETCQELSKLYTQVGDSVEPENLDALIDHAVQKGWREQFASIDEKPFAVASVGQVHKAELQSGEKVAVKLIKKDFVKSFKRDVRSVDHLLNIVLFFYPKLRGVADPKGILKSIHESTIMELDLRNEIAHAKKLEELHEKWKSTFDLSKIVFPKIYEELSSEKVMVSELVPGNTLDALLEKGNCSYDTLLDLFHIHGFYLFCLGTFHGDIHPGNILLHDGIFRFVDTGALGTVGERLRTGLFAFMAHLSNDEYKECAASLNAMAERRIEGEKFAAFEKKFLELYADYKGKTVTDVSLTRQMMKTIKLGVESGMRFEQGMYPVIKSLMYLDGMVLRSNPRAILMHDVRRFIAEFRPYLS